MMLRLSRGATMIPVMLTAFAAAEAQPQSVDARGAERFLNLLQRAVDSNDRPAVSRLFKYPSTVLASGFNIPVSDSKELLRMYDLIFNSDMRCAIVDSGFSRSGAPRPRRPVDLQADGLALAGGLVWAQKSGNAFRVTRVTVPASTAVPRSREPRRVRFLQTARGEHTAQYYNWLERDDRDAYLVLIRKGQFLQVRIEGFEGNAAAVQVIEAGGAPSTAAETARTWTGYAPSTGDYRIEVIRLVPYCDPKFQYKLFITLR